MPMIHVHTHPAVPAAARDTLIAKLSKTLADLTQKPERYVMALLSDSTILMAGKPGPGAFVDVRGIGGLTPAVNKALAKGICDILSQALQIPPDRVYLNFTDVAAVNWGHNGGTFG